MKKYNLFLNILQRLHVKHITEPSLQLFELHTNMEYVLHARRNAIWDGWLMWHRVGHKYLYRHEYGQGRPDELLKLLDELIKAGLFVKAKKGKTSKHILITVAIVMSRKKIY